MTSKHPIILCSAILGTGINAAPPPAASEQTRLASIYHEENRKTNRMVVEYGKAFDDNLLPEIEKQQLKETNARIALLQQDIVMLKKNRNHTVEWRVGTIASGKPQKLKFQGASIMIQQEFKTEDRELDDLIDEFNKKKSGQSLMAVKAKIIEIEDLRIQSEETRLAALKAEKSNDAAQRVNALQEYAKLVRIIIAAREAGNKDSTKTEKDKAVLKERLDAFFKQKSAKAAEQKKETVEQTLNAIQSGEYQRTLCDGYKLGTIAQNFLLPNIPPSYLNVNEKLYPAIYEYDRTKDGKTLATIKELLIEREDVLIKEMGLEMENARRTVAKLLEDKAK